MRALNVKVYLNLNLHQNPKYEKNHYQSTAHFCTISC